MTAYAAGFLALLFSVTLAPRYNPGDSSAPLRLILVSVRYHRLARSRQLKHWRRGRDSNPRYPFGYAGFQDRSHQPLGHLSAAQTVLPQS